VSSSGLQTSACKSCTTSNCPPSSRILPCIQPSPSSLLAATTQVSTRSCVALLFSYFPPSSSGSPGAAVSPLRYPRWRARLARLLQVDVRPRAAAAPCLYR
jgi:hypothetical protein